MLYFIYTDGKQTTTHRYLSNVDVGGKEKRFFLQERKKIGGEESCTNMWGTVRGVGVWKSKGSDNR